MICKKTHVAGILLGIMTQLLFAQTEKYGVIDGDERWTMEHSPYVISDDLYVSPKGRLIISPGVKVIIGKPSAYHPRIKQLDHIDSFNISIQVEGIFTCVGRPGNRISFVGESTDSLRCDWYGIVLNGSSDNFTELAFTDIAGACYGLSVRACGPLIRNCVFEYNNVGMKIEEVSDPQISNCVIAHNFTAGTRITRANPEFFNNLIVFNRNNGLWCDGVSRITFEYNCVFGNGEKDLIDCNPELGIPVDENKNGDSVDFEDNLFMNPVFAGTAAESLSVEHDTSLPTDKSRIKDTALAKVIYDSLVDTTVHQWRIAPAKRYMLSTYSPCIDAGKKDKIFRDADGSRNDIGLYGGPEFIHKDN